MWHLQRGRLGSPIKACTSNHCISYLLQQDIRPRIVAGTNGSPLPFHSFGSFDRSSGVARIRTPS